MITIFVSIFQIKFCLLLYFVAPLANSANHYCIDNTVSSIAIPFDSEQPERLLTNIRNQDRYLPSQRCTWEIWIKDLVEPRQLVLQPTTRPMVGRRSEGGTNGSDCGSTFTVEMEGGQLNVTMLNGESPRDAAARVIVPFNSSSQKLVVTFNTGESPPSADCPRVELTITMAKKGFCGWSMLLHRLHCYLVTDSNILMSHERGSGLTLAGFSDVTQLRDLLRDNNLRISQYPYKRPLDLSTPVRIGVFKCPGSRQAYYRDSNCWKPFNSSGLQQDLEGNGTAVETLDNFCGSSQCAVVKELVSTAEPHKLELLFTSCSSSMPSLLRFPELPDRKLDIIDEKFCKSGVQNNSHLGYRALAIKCSLITLAVVTIVLLIFCCWKIFPDILPTKRTNRPCKTESSPPAAVQPTSSLCKGQLSYGFIQDENHSVFGND